MGFHHGFAVGIWTEFLIETGEGSPTACPFGGTINETLTLQGLFGGYGEDGYHRF